MKINKLFACLVSIIIAISIAGCAKKSEDSKSDKSQSITEVKQSESKTSEGQSNIGEYLEKAAEIYKSGKYTMKSTVTSTAFDGEIRVTRVVNGDSIYQLQEERKGSYGVVSVGEEAYDFDNSCGMYRKSQSVPVTTVVEEVVNQNLPKNNVQNKAPKGYAVEQYTFTGSTYITNIDFYFDETTGELKKYVMNYISEGEEDVIETREIESVSETVNEKMFDLKFINDMVDFEELTEEKRKEFCRKICNNKGITVDILNDLDITSESFKTMTFDSFFNLVYTYGK